MSMFGLTDAENIALATYLLFAATASLAVIAFIQLNKLVHSIRGDTYQSIVNNLIDIEKMFVQDPKLLKVWGPEPAPPFYDPDRGEEGDKLEWLGRIGIDYLQVLHHQYEEGNMKEKLWNQWIQFYSQAFRKNTHLWKVWQNAKNEYNPDFIKALDDAISSNSSEESQN